MHIEDSGTCTKAITMVQKLYNLQRRFSSSKVPNHGYSQLNSRSMYTFLKNYIMYL